MPKSSMKKLRAAAARFKKEEPLLYKRLAYSCTLKAKAMLNPETPDYILKREAFREHYHL